MKKILVDIDKTLTYDTCWTPEEALRAKPNQKLFDEVNKLGAIPGNDIIIYTARRNLLMAATFEWLHQYLTCPFSVSNYKVHGDLFIDNDSVTEEDIIGLYEKKRRPK